MTESWGNVSRRRLLETIVILWTLTEVPGGSDVHKSARPQPENSGARQLTFEREKGLVEILAFLSGTRDDPSKVMAVCIEEGLAGDSLTIRLASNSDTCSDVLSGFRKIATILEQSWRREKKGEVSRHDLLREIVCLDFWRILARLRSTHAKSSRKTTGRPSLILQLSEAVKSPLHSKGKKLSADTVEALRNKVQDISILVIRLEAISDVHVSSSTIQDLLMDLVSRFSQLASDGTLSDLLEKAIDLNASVELHLKSAVGKLGRYFSASQDLVGAARTKRYSVFNKILVEQYHLPSPPPSYLLGSQTTLKRSINDLINREKVLQGCRLSASVQNYLGNLYLTKSENFQIRTSKSLDSWKVHAEIKLLFFYEMHKADVPPRVIFSSKSPCYLCHSYFDLHGKYQIAETHGRLYPGWILPTWLEQLSHEERAQTGRTTDALHKRLVLRVQQLVEKKRVPFKYPNESVLWPTASWSASSLGSISTNNHPQKSIELDEKALNLEAVEKASEVYKISTKHRGSPLSSIAQVQSTISAVDASPLMCDQSKSKEDYKATKSYSLNPGETTNIQIVDAAMEPRITTKRLNLVLGRDSFRENGASDTCWVRCRLLDNFELPEAISNQPVDVRSMTPGSEVTLETGFNHAATDLLIVAFDEILSIKYSTKEIPGADAPTMTSLAT